MKYPFSFGDTARPFVHLEVLVVEVFAELAVAVVLDVADVFDAEAAVAEVLAAIWVDAVCLALVVEEVLVVFVVLDGTVALAMLFTTEPPVLSSSHAYPFSAAHRAAYEPLGQIILVLFGNALSPMDSIDAGKVTSLMSVMPNAKEPKVVTPSGMVTSVRLVLLKALFPMTRTDDGISTFVIPLQLVKRLLGIVVTSSPITTSERDLH